MNGKTAGTPCLIGAMNATTFLGNLREVLNGEVTPDHDQPYYNVDGRGVSVWIPVDPVRRTAAWSWWPTRIAAPG